MSEQIQPQAIRDLAPASVLYHIATGHYLSRALYVAAKLGIADLLNHGPMSCDELARITESHAPSLLRVVRLLVSVGVFSESQEGTLALTPVGEALRSEAARSIALLFAGDMLHEAWGGLLHTVKTGEMSFRHVFGADPFEYFANHPEDAKVFDEAMTSGSARIAANVSSGYDFSSFDTIADIGGGQGALLAAILTVNPKASGVLFEVPRVTQAAILRFREAGLADRCLVIGGDFFVEVPAGADVYVIKSVIHDWNDERSVEILRNCRRAMRSSSKLLLIEQISPTQADESLASLNAAKDDVNMMLVAGGRSRSEAEFRALLELSGFHLQAIFPIRDSPAKIIEAVLQ